MKKRPASPKKKQPAKTSPVEKQAGVAGDAGLEERLKTPKQPKPFEPSETQQTVIEYIDRRIEEMMDFRESLGIEKKWKEADEEYIPHEMDYGTTRKRFETDQDSGLRSRMVPVGDATQQWRSAAAAPTLLAKIQVAVSIIIDNQPEADLVALIKKYSATTELAYSLWKRNWSITNAKENLKLIVFDLFKYGWAVQHTYPRTVRYPKKVLVSLDTEKPENNRYEDREITWFSDVDRSRLDPYRTWIDELTKPYDPYSCNEGYFEIDFSFDAFKVEFGKYPGAKYVRPDSQMIRPLKKKGAGRQAPETEDMKRKDIVTVGFFESRTKDMYAIWIPKDKILVNVSPIPNDDGYLSLTQTLLMLRKGDSPYGISLWEVIRSNKQLYDKMKNMTMDQLVLSIMKFGMHTGTSAVLGDGKIEIIPGQSRQVNSSTGSAKDAQVWMEIPGPGAEAWKGLEAIQDMMDDDSGITPMLEGGDTPGTQTLGELLHRKEAALKRLKTPMENIAWLIEQDAYLTLSWMSQVYSVPAVVDFADIAELVDYERENDMNRSKLFGTPQLEEDGTTPKVDPMTGQQALGAPYQAHFLPQLSLHLEDHEGKLVKSKESKFYQVGDRKDPETGKLLPNQIMPSQIKWRGIFKVIPRSIVDSSQELVKASKMEVFNMIMPLLQFPPELVARPIAQMLKVVEEDPKDWLPDAYIAFLSGEAPPQPAPGGAVAPPGTPGATPPGNGAPPPPGTPPGAGGGPQPPAMPSPGGQTIQSTSGMTPGQTATIVPGSSMPSIAQLTGGKAGIFNRRL